MAEGGVGEHGDARLVAHAAGETGGLLGDVGEFLGGRHVVHGGVGDEHGRPRQSTIETPMTRWPGLASMTRRTSSSAVE
jgi:hypothetical protein